MVIDGDESSITSRCSGRVRGAQAPSRTAAGNGAYSRPECGKSVCTEAYFK